MDVSEGLVIYRFAHELPEPRWKRLYATELVCDGCGATAGTDEKHRGLYRDADAGGAPCIKCRCGMIYYTTPTQLNARNSTIELIVDFDFDLSPNKDGVLEARKLTLRTPDRVETLVLKREGWREVHEWADAAYRMVFVNDGEWATLTYAEGDLIFRWHPTAGSYAAELRHAAAFYKGFVDSAGNPL